MIRRLIILMLVHSSLLLSQTQIAVVDFEALGVSNDDARALTNRLMIEMHRTNKFKVLEREMLDKIIEEQKFQLSGCNSDVCLVELGQIANVQQMVAGSISKVGDVFTITARLISVESGEVIESALYDYEGKIGALMKTGMTNIASQLASIPFLAQSQVSDNINIQSKTTLNNESSIPTNEESVVPELIPKLFSPGESVTDIDGNVYATIKIGDQVWMAENLKVTHYQNGDPIPFMPKGRAWMGTEAGAYCYYTNDSKNSDVYGNLYNWYAIDDNRRIAPKGWHVPSVDEWQTLVENLGGNAIAGGKLKERGTTHWVSPNKGANNQSGFSALPAGLRTNVFGAFRDLKYYGYFWTNTAGCGQFCSCIFGLERGYESITKLGKYQNYGLSVRCIKD